MPPVYRSMTGGAPHSRHTGSGPQMDPEAPTERGGVDAIKGSPKKWVSEAQACRRARPHTAMLGGIGVIFLCAFVLYSFHDDAQTQVDFERSLKGSITNSTMSVEFSVPGLYIPMAMALDVRLPVLEEEERYTRRREVKNGDALGLQAVVSRNTLEQQHAGADAFIKAAMSSTKSGPGDSMDWHPLNGIRLLVAVTSACCSDISLARREEIRNTWAKLTKERYPSGVDIVFFLAQPEDSNTYARWLPVVEQEAKHHGDIVILRGRDTYMNLPNKTFRMLKYALAHPKQYSHVLKADDDTWVRIHRLIQVLHELQPLKENLEKMKIEDKSIKPSHAEDEKILKTKQEMKTQLSEMSKSRGSLITSDGIALYDATPVLKKVEAGVDGYSLNTTVDDVDGTSVTLSTLAARAFEDNSQHSVDLNTTNLAPTEGVAQSTKKQRTLLSRTPTQRSPSMNGVYLGCVEVKSGFQPIRDPSSKWYISKIELPDDQVPWGVQYLAGWGYVLSRDLVGHVVQKVDGYEADPESAPMWYNKLHWEDVLVGALVEDVTEPRSHVAFRPAWRSCHVETAVRHLDIDSPRLLRGLVAQDASGLSDEKAVQCSSGQFLPGDYRGWYEWRTGLDAQQ